MYVEWKGQYEVGIVKFDDQHKKLCALINELHDGVNDYDGGHVMKRVLQGLIEYAMNHFADEEKLMLKHGYPEYAEHKKEHDEMADKLSYYVDGYIAGRAQIKTEILDFLVNWLETHMVQTDGRYVQFFRERGIT